MQTVRLVPTTHNRRPPAQISLRAWPTQAIMFSTAQQQQLRALQTPTATWEVHSQPIVFATRATRDQTGGIARRVKQANTRI